MRPYCLELEGDISFKKEENQFQIALDKYIEASKLDNENCELYIKQGKCYEKRREFDLATTAFSKAVEVNPLSPWAHFRLGWVNIRNG